MIVHFQHEIKELSSIKAEIAAKLSDSNGKVHVCATVLQRYQELSNCICSCCYDVHIMLIE